MSSSMWVVSSGDFEGSYTEGIFSSIELAEEWVNAQEYPDDYYIEELSVNPDPPKKKPEPKEEPFIGPIRESPFVRMLKDLFPEERIEYLANLHVEKPYLRGIFKIKE